MKKIIALALVCLGLFAGASHAQVTVTGAVVGDGTYATLGAAFTAINGGAQPGANIAVTITASTTEGAATATLNAGTWATLTIQPSGGAWTISGTTTAGNPMVDFNGADNVTVDGLNAGGNALTFDNTTVSATSGTSTIRFQTDATNNTITRCTVNGASTMAVGTNGGNIWFGANSTTTGNDNNTISFCNIGPSGANLPTKGIYFTGTTTSTATNNSGVIITDNNIFDYFSATTTSAGVYVTTGSTDITVQNNKFYQTATRTQTTGTQHSAIWITNTTGNNYQVLGNIIGYATNAQTGTYTFAGVAGSQVVPISISTGSTTASSVQGNTITAIAMSGSMSGASTTSPFRGIYVANPGLVNTGNITPNTIGSLTTNGAISYTTSSASNSEIMGYYNFGVAACTVNNNNIGGITAGNSATGAILLYAIRINTLSSVSSTIQNNNIGGATVSSIQSTAIGSTGCQVYGILVNTSNSTITGNNIASLSVSAGNGTTTTPSVAGIVVNATSSNHTVTGNRIAGIGNLNPASTGHVTGIMFNSSTGANVIGENFIHSLAALSAGVTMNGIYVAGGTATYRNNMIRLGIDPSGAALTTGFAINGINEAAGTDNFYFNSIYIGGSGVGGAANTFAFNSVVVTNVRNFQNNIFFNARSNGAGTGKHYGIRVGGTAVNPAGLTCNFNMIYVNGTGGVFGLFNAIDRANLTAWQTATGQDGSSLFGDPVFVNPIGTGLTVDLHVNSPTPIEAAGTPVAAVTTDYDGQTRSTLTPTDIGADAGNFTAQDISAPVISYSPLSFNCSLGDRVFSATITDLSGVPTTGAFQPRVYYSKNAGPWFSSQGVLSSGTATNGTWNFTIVASDMGGLIMTDVVTYYVIAQDVAPTPNIRSNPSIGLVASDVNTVTTPPTTPNSYGFSNTLAGGTYTVGVGGNYTTLTAAVNAYNTSCIGGPIVFSLIDATYPSETFPIQINANAYASSVNTLTIQPASGVNATISGSSATAVIILNGADYVTINGSNNPVTNTMCPRVLSSRNLTITNTAASGTVAVISLQTTAGGDGASNNKIINCNITGNTNLITTVLINISGPTIGAAAGAASNSNNQIINNSLTKGVNGIYSIGGTGALQNQNNVFDLNDMSGSGANSISIVAISVLNENNPSIQGNTIANMVSTLNADVIAISVGSTQASNTFTGTTVETNNAVIAYNVIDNIVQSNTFSAVGINFVGGTGAGTTRIFNNTINRVFANGTSPDFGGGIFYCGTSANTGLIYNNTINVTSATALTGASQPSFGIGINGTTPTVDIRNNIIVCSGSTGANLNTGIALGYTSTTGNYLNLVSNYNDISVSGTGSAVGQTGSLGTAGTRRVTLANWQTETGRDANSTVAVPVFVSASDPHMVAGSNPGIEDAGIFLPSITSDVDCQTRSTCTPDIGADEFGSPAEINVQGNSTTIVDGDATPSAGDFTVFGTMSVCNGTLSRTFTIQNTGLLTLNISSVTISGANAADFSVTTPPAATVAGGGSTTFTVTFDPSVNGVESATINVNSNDCDEAIYDFAVNGTGTQIVATAASQTNVSCNGGNNGSASVSVTGGIATITYLWAPSGGTAATATGLTAGSYTCTATDANGCASAVTFLITEPTPLTASISSQTNVACNGDNTGSLTASVSGGTGSYTYSWTPSGGTAATASSLAAGSYTCNITDANGCAQTVSATITEPSAITSSISSSTNVSCNGGSNGSATVSASGGTGSFTYSWAPSGGTAATASGLTAGTYTCTITDANLCTHQQAVTIAQPSAITSSISSSTNVSCNGGSNGSATVSASGGTGTLTYSWAPSGGTAATASGLTAGTYTCTITDANLCTHQQTVTIAQPSAITSSISSSTNVSCNGGSNGSATVSASGGTGTLTYSWAPSGGTAATATGLSANTYTCTITDANLCTHQQTVTIAQPTAITSSISSSTNVSCNGGNNGSATVSASGGTGTLTYAWAPSGGTAATATGLSANTYTCTITDANLCTHQQTVTIAQPSAITSSISSSTNVSCNGGNNGAATVSASGGTGTLTYSWAPSGGTAATASGLTAGTYTCTITDANSCVRTQTVTIAQPSAITSSISSSTNVSCNGGNNGAATVSASGGTGTLTYSWAPSGGTAATASGLTAGTYTCTITDANSCVRTQTVTIAQPSAITSSISSSTNVSCNGGSNGSATVSASGGTGTLTYLWAPSGGTTATATGLTAGTYTCTITDANSCVRTQTVTIAQPTAITSSLTSTTDATCGNSNGAATVSASGGTGTLTYAWTPSGGTAATATGLAAGSYTCTITDANACTRQQTATINNIGGPVVTLASQTNVSCNGGNNGAATVTATGVATLTYAWAPSGGTAATASALAANTYTCTVTDGNGCIQTQTVTITQPSAITSSISSSTNVSCNGGSNGSATVSASGGTGTLTYSWAPSGGTAATATGLSANTYTCTITDANLCTHQQTVTIAQPSAITSSISSSTNVSCNGGNNGSATVSASGGTGTLTYSWAPTGGTAATATGLTAGTYTCTITDANSCVRTQTVTIAQPSAITSSISSSTNVSCNGGNNGSATVSASGGTGTLTYSWAPSGGTAATATGLTANTYTCTITDANLCTHQQTVTIAQPSAITSSISSSTNVSCNGGSNGSATVSASGGTGSFTYSWAPSGGTSATATGLTAGTYTCTITDANSCVRTQTVTIAQPSAITSSISSSTNVSCNGGNNGSATVSASGGTGTLTYSWAPAGGTAATATGLAAGTYTCTITDANGCIRTQTVSITQPTAITSSISSSTNVSCNGGSNGSATVSASGGTGTLSYAWTPSGGNAATATGLAMGTYTCTITDANGCVRTQTVSITQPTAITASVASQTNVTCNTGNNGSVTVAASGGTGALTYAWTPSGGTAATASGLTAGSYTCTITDANGCTATQTATVTQPTAITSSISAQTNITCNGGNNGSATVMASGGTGVLTYAWAPTGGTAATASGLTAGNYTCTITDASGCTGTQTVAITQPTAVTASLSSSTNVTCNAGTDGAATITAGGGTGTLSYSWTPSGGNAATATGLAMGTYTCTVTDNNGCTTTQTVSITQPTAITGTVTSVTDATCGNANGSATVSASGGTGTLSYSWAPSGGSSATATNLLAGGYIVTVTDASGCTSMVPVLVNNAGGPVVATVSQTDVTCNGGNNGAATISASGNGTLTYDWTPGNPTGDGTVSVSGLTQGTWTCTVTDINGCIGTHTVAITEPTAITSFVASQSNVSCNGGNDGTAIVNASGGTGTLSYAWSSGSTTNTEVAMTMGTYTVTITDANSCSHVQLVTITEPLAVTATVVSSNNVSCNGANDGSATVSASGGTGTLSYSWAPSGGITPTASSLSPNTYTCTVTDVNGCTGTATTTITEPAPVTVNANASSSAVCAGSSVTFTGSGSAVTYVWTGGVTDGVPFTPSVTDTYTVTGTDASGCTNTNTVTVTVNTLPSVSANASAVVVCAGTPVTFTGSGSATSYVWTGGVTDGVPFTTSATNTFTVTGTDGNGCSDTSSIMVTVNSVPVVTLGPDQALCSGTVTLDAGNPGETYNWSNSTTAQTLVASVTGIYWVDVTNASGCTTRDSVTITINANPVVALGVDTTMCGGVITLDAGNPGATYLWNDNSTNQTLVASASGTYFVTATLTGGCTATDTISVTINTPPVVTFSMPMDTMCDIDAAATLSALPAGGTFSGPGVTGNSFDPATLNGAQMITYMYTDSLGCSSSVTDSVIVDICMGTVNPVATFGMNVYPNPNFGQFVIELNYVPENVVNVEITNSLGQVVAVYEMTGTTLEVNISQYEGGIYNVRVMDGATVYVGRIVKE